MLNQLHLGCCLDIMRQLPDASVDAIISDPPYHTTQLHYDRAPMIDWAAWWREAWRVVKPTGVVVLFADGPFTIDLILTQRQHYRYRLVWEKTMPTGFLDANRRPLRSHEDVLVFVKQLRQSTYNPQRTKAVQVVTNTRKTSVAAHYGGKQCKASSYQDDGTRLPTSVLKFPSVPRQYSLHPSQKPANLLSWLVRTYTNPGQVVLDTFAGSATTAVACIAEGRQFVCCERDEAYYNKAQARIAAAQAPHPQPV